MEEKNRKDPVTEETADAENTPDIKMSDTAEAANTAETTDSAEDKKDKKRADKKQKAELDRLKAELDAKTAALTEADDKYLRLMAEYDNFRRRSREEKDAVYSAAVSDTVSELLPLFDNLELAAKYTGDNTSEAAKGVSMILASVPDILEKLNVSSFGEAGDSFDPNIHNAVMHTEDDSLGEGVITDVFQKGYRLGDKIIRFATVKVAN